MFQSPAADFIFFVCPVFVFCLKNKQTLLAVICVFILKWMLTAESCLEWTSYANIWADCCKYYCTTHKVSFRRSRLKPDYWLKSALSVLLWIFHFNLKFSSLCCNTDSAVTPIQQETAAARMFSYIYKLSFSVLWNNMWITERAQTLNTVWSQFPGNCCFKNKTNLWSFLRKWKLIF